MSGPPQENPENTNIYKLFIFSLTILLLLTATLISCTSPVPTPTVTPAPPAVPTDTPTTVPSPTTELPTSTPTPKSSPTPLAIVIKAPSTLPNLNMPASVSDIVAGADKSVVAIAVVTGTGIFQSAGAGTGIVVDPNGYIVTNFHVIQDARDITVILLSGLVYKAKVVGVDELTDLAVVKIEEKDLPAATFGDSEQMKVGDWVIAIGNALNLKGAPSVTLGIISARERSVNTDYGPLYDLLQTDASINEGNSGGPLLNTNGEIVGINSAILRRAQGVGFAISSKLAVPVIQEIIQNGKASHPSIGLIGTDLTPTMVSQLGLKSINGVVVSRVTLGSAADKAGISVGDVIISVDGVPAPDVGRFLSLLWNYKPGDTVEIEYLRSGQSRTARVQLSS